MRILGMLLAIVTTSGLNAQSFREQGQLAAQLGNHKVAVMLFEKAVSSAALVFEDTDIEMTVRRAELGEAYRMDSRWPEAILQLDYVWKRARADAISLSRWESQEGDLALGCAEKLARCYQATANHDKVIEVIKLALEDNALHRRRLAERAQFLVLLTDTLLVLKQEKEALDAAKEAMDLAELMIADDPMHTASVCSVLGAVYLSHQRDKEARQLLQRAVDLAALHLEPSHNDRAHMQQQLATALVKTGALDEALLLLQDTATQLQKNPVLNQETLLSIHLSTANVLLKKGDSKGAIEQTLEARALCEEHFSKDRYEYARSYLLSGLAHMQLKQPNAAQSDLESAYKIMRSTLGEDHPDATTVKRALSELGQKKASSPGISPPPENSEKVNE